MAYDEELAERIREVLDSRPSPAEEKKMFGGLAFLIGGNMAVAASRSGGLMVRTDPSRSEHLVSTTTATPMVMRGREMPGWLLVPPEDLKSKAQLKRWVGLGVDFADTLPPKRQALPPARTRRRPA